MDYWLGLIVICLVFGAITAAIGQKRTCRLANHSRSGRCLGSSAS
jgi:hypothetical protein